MDCGANQMETISGGDPSVPEWPYLFEAVTRGDSPVRESVAICNNRFFPLQFDNRKSIFESYFVVVLATLKFSSELHSN